VELPTTWCLLEPEGVILGGTNFDKNTRARDARNLCPGTVAEIVAGTGLEALVSPETVRSENAVNTSESKRNEISQNCRAEIMSPLL
jgi:hypothetical protein